MASSPSTPLNIVVTAYPSYPPPVPPNTRTPAFRVGVGTGKGRGPKFLPEGYPGRSLIANALVILNCRAFKKHVGETNNLLARLHETHYKYSQYICTSKPQRCCKALQTH